MAMPLAAPPAPGSTVRTRELQWVSRSSCPPEWLLHVERCGGAYFHSPLGLLAGAPAGQPLFVQLLHEGRVVGVGAGVRHGCRFSLRPKHVYFPTLPALVCPGREDAALAALADELRRQGAVEAVFDSFDAAWQPSRQLAATRARQRTEYVVPLQASEEEQAARCDKHHRRYAARGLKEGWSLGMLGGDEARALLAEVQRDASERAAGRGQHFSAEPPAIAAIAVTRLTDPWGATVFGAWDRDTLLAAALIGWANRRAYYISGGSTPAGYACHGSIWLHLKIMAALAATGMRSYNLGGTAASAADPGDPEHGLHRFKSNFGAELRPCGGAQWALQPAHARTHQIVAEIMGAGAA